MIRKGVFEMNFKTRNLKVWVFVVVLFGFLGAPQKPESLRGFCSRNFYNSST